MMTEPQRLEYNNRGGLPPAIVVQFPEHSKPIQLPIDKVIYFHVDEVLLSLQTHRFLLEEN